MHHSLRSLVSAVLCEKVSSSYNLGHPTSFASPLTPTAMSSYAIDENFSPEGSELSNQASVSEESNEVAHADADARPTKIRQARACAECNRCVSSQRVG